MTTAAMTIMTTVNAPYGANLTAHQLAVKIAALESVSPYDASVFAFFSEVKPALQVMFIEEMGVDKAKAQNVARGFALKSGFPLAPAQQ